MSFIAVLSQTLPCFFYFFIFVLRVSTHLDSLSNMLISFMASYSFCSSVIPSMGSGCSSSTTPVTGLMLARQKSETLVSGGSTHQLLA